MQDLHDYYTGKDIVVTGGVGSIGSEICKQLLAFKPRQVRIFDNRETEVFHMQHMLQDYKNVRYLMGDVREKERLRKAFSNAHIVFHAAALKHVPSCEYNPFEAVKTNIMGTQNIIEAAIDAGVEKVIFVSTDKAVNPINTMGATKLLAEKLILNANITSNENTVFSCVRFGNVLNSAGSVIPLFKDQIKKHKEITLTHDSMTRFFISIPQAISLVLRAGRLAKGREIFVLNMDAMNIRDLAEVIIDEVAPIHGLQAGDIKINNIGLRPGEKIDELLMTDEERCIAENNGDIFILRPGFETPHYSEQDPPTNGVEKKHYHSKHAHILSKQEIRSLLKKENIL